MKQTTSSRSLVAACDDGRLFGFPLWPRQRALLAAIEHGPRMHVLALGRRSGKTTMAALVGLWDCLLRPELDSERPGGVSDVASVLPPAPQTRITPRVPGRPTNTKLLGPGRVFEYHRGRQEVIKWAGTASTAPPLAQEVLLPCVAQATQVQVGRS